MDHGDFTFFLLPGRVRARGRPRTKMVGPSAATVEYVMLSRNDSVCFTFLRATALYAKRAYAIAISSVRLSVTRVDQSKNG